MAVSIIVNNQFSFTISQISNNCEKRILEKQKLSESALVLLLNGELKSNHPKFEDLFNQENIGLYKCIIKER